MTGLAAKIKQDWHIHTTNSDGAMPMAALPAAAEQLGIAQYGVTDHLNTQFNRPFIANSRRDYDAVLAENPALKGRFHFGVEASCVSAWEIDKIRRGDYEGEPVWGIRSGGPAGAALALDIDKAFIEEFGIAYVVGGVHWPMYCAADRHAVLEDYHRQYLFMARHALVDILAHWLWWNPMLSIRDGIACPFLDFGAIPARMKEELAQALLKNGTAFEINIGEFLMKQPFYSSEFMRGYLAYAARLQALGVTLSIGSDTHQRDYFAYNRDQFTQACEMMEAAGIDLSGNFFAV